MIEDRNGLSTQEEGSRSSVHHYTPRSAFLEFGSTSIKFYVLGAAGDSAGQVEEELKFAWDLGYDVFQHARISPGTVTRCLTTLRGLRADYPDIPLEAVTAVGTSALREAQNADLFQRVLWDELRIKIHIIEGGIEAFLLETGFRESVKAYPTGLFDLGGGSLELVEYLSQYSTKKTSLPVGAIRLHCQLRHTRDLFSYIGEGRRIVEETLRQHLAGQTPPYRELIGTGGTVRAVVEITGKDAFDANDVHGILQREVHGPGWENLASHRRKALLPGIIAIEGLFASLGLDRVIYRTASVKRGLMTLMRLLPPASSAGRAPSSGVR
jgi:exopolyphosphatase/pppGpp-phosphohydrolase